MRSVQEIINEAREAVVHGDAGPAWRCLRELVELEKGSSGSSLSPEVMTLKTDLRYTALPTLSVEEAASILQSEIINLFSRGIDLDDRLSVRYAFTVYGDHEMERQELRKAILGNKEQVAGNTIGEWLKEFDKKFPPATRDSRHVFEFLSTNRQLSERDRLLLTLILTAYENWLATERLNIFDLAYLKQHPEIVAEMDRSQSSGQGPYNSSAANQAYQSREQQSRTSAPAQKLKLPLLKALADYPRLSDQLITTEKIKLKGQSDLQRPSLANWIHYYREELGIGFHDQVTRGRFLFQSENGKRLSADERERINLLLKSIEEEFPLEIDTDRQMVIFPAKSLGAPTVPLAGSSSGAAALFPQRSGVPARPTKPFQPMTPATPVASESAPGAAPGSQTSFFERQFRPAKNVAGETLHFSTGHVLPGEKETPAPSPEGTAAPAGTPTFRPNGIVQERGAALPRSPYSIRPLRMRSNDEPTSENKV